MDHVTGAGARVMAFLAGPPDYGRGAVLRPAPRTLPPADSGPPLFDPTFPDVNPYAFVPLAAASGRGVGVDGAALDASGDSDAQVPGRPEPCMQASALHARAAMLYAVCQGEGAA